MQDRYDAIIVGGGIGGSALAIVLARAGRQVLLLEQSTVYEDKVRGEWLSPWGVKEAQRIGLYDLLVRAGGHHILRHFTFDESRAPAESVAAVIPLEMFVPGVTGPLAIGHPHHCQTLFDEAGRAGADTLRGVNVSGIHAGAAPSVTFEHEGTSHTKSTRLIVGADGRQSMVRQALGIRLHQDQPHHWFAGLLVDGAEGWDDTVQAIGTEGDLNFLAFPQGGGRVRVYGSYALDQRGRFGGENGTRHFLDAFRMQCSPDNRHLADGNPAGPLFSYFNNDSWTDEPFDQGAVLIGDAAGWNDPIIGLGLSITYRDVRIVADILKETDDWSRVSFAPYAEERTERLRRLRYAASLVSTLDAEFDENARARRAQFLKRSATDPTLISHIFAVLAGPEALPPEVFTPESRARVLGG